MSINLSFYLDKNKLSLSKLCTRMKFTSYNDIVEYCKNKKFNCDIKESETAEIFVKKVSETVPETVPEKVPEKVIKEVKNEPEKPKTRRRGRKPKTKKAGTSNKKSDS